MWLYAWGVPNAKESTMTDATNTTTRDESAWQTYRQTARTIDHMIAALQAKLADHRMRARNRKDDWLYDADLRSVAQYLNKAIDELT